MLDVPPHELASPPPDLAGLCCLQCGYNLTGLTETRCPECGTTFDPAELRRLLDPTPQQVAAHGFWDLYWQTITQPTAFARRFPAVHDWEQAGEYGWKCMTLSAVVFLVAAMPIAIAFGEPEAVFVFCAAGTIGALAAVALCEVGSAAVLALLFQPNGAARRFHFWHGLMRYGRGFAVLTALSAAHAMNMTQWLGGSPGVTAFLFLAVLPAIVVFASWSYSMGQMVRARTVPGGRRFLIRFSIPAVGLLAVCAGVWIGRVVLGMLVTTY